MAVRLLFLMLVVSAVMVLIFWKASRSGYAAIAICFLGGELLAICSNSNTPGLIILVLTLLSIPCCFWKVPRFQVLMLHATATSLVFVGFYVVSLLSDRPYRALDYNFPVISMTDRLTYEAEGTRHHSASALTAHAIVSPENRIDLEGELARVEARLDEEGRPFLNREESIATFDAVHDHFVEKFVEAQGFGFQRARGIAMRQYNRKVFRLEPIELPKPSVQHSADPAVSDDPTEPPTQPAATAVPVASDLLRDLHEDSALDFVNRPGFGYISSREHVRGFQSHGFRKIPKVNSEQQQPTWTVTRLQLVSLLKHDQPIVYLSDDLPNMENLANVSTRPINAFETQALKRLASGEEIVVSNEAGSELSMLGSIRAARQCTQCHAVQRGTLLGAFSYRLHRDGATVRKAPPEKSPPQI